MTGVLCDKNVPDRFKSKVYRAVVRSAALYGAECWPATKEVERRLSVMETKMLRWTAGVTRAYRIRNEKIRERFGIAPIADKLREIRLRWYGHVLRANEDTICKEGLDLEVPGKLPEGRPKQRWLDTLHADLKHICQKTRSYRFDITKMNELGKANRKVNDACADLKKLRNMRQTVLFIIEYGIAWIHMEKNLSDRALIKANLFQLLHRYEEVISMIDYQRSNFNDSVGSLNSSVQKTIEMIKRYV
ncbi:hypothetical protein Y032_0757g2097 [Ancylostoma ceylanicum]|uniref:Reverse transcriptase domain-containing protein n=1 Tax=Ancylostoma ceylanicum TaxID=53326 RepID=A0A016WE45_9BILA|nr:hypothetical protein Y032_0757g2097 [Ancylostoma ceylanicum]